MTHFNSIRFSRAAVATVAAIAVIGFGVQSAAARDMSTQLGQVKISYADLDLSSRRGAEVMTARIHNAARDICGGEARSYADFVQRRLAKDCIAQTSARAATRLGSPLVTAMVTGASAVMVAGRSRTTASWPAGPGRTAPVDPSSGGGDARVSPSGPLTAILVQRVTLARPGVRG